ncbi:acyl-CoA dehydrogenase family protein [Sphingosinithalassobacter sp. CS137]|uniref:acyl-CoA dehydrogenase family protein n=1 Tax=Sphingosinithalassobacter sp. CS137 TaxID=2762748 RepID=UPI00165EA51D|nr:acyl-CoA dehydrogenase family protein [Sphingosinithalassobacter sp. CS137]
MTALGATAEALRHEVRNFLAHEFPQDVLAKARAGTVPDRDDHIRMQRALHARGWLAPAWPAEHGGPGWTPAERYVFEQEMERAGAPPIIPMGIIYVGPVIYTFGTPDQQRRWLPDILESRSIWAQGYSEPEAGSDLASLSMRAERAGDRYRVTGTKIWTTQAHWADWIFCLVRTSREARRQGGISFLCIEMDSPGVTVHPIVTLDGVHHLNRVEFRDVEVPLDQRIGEEGAGWRYANALLRNERISYAHVARKRADLDLLEGWAQRMALGGEASAIAREAAACRVAVDMLEMRVLRLLGLGDNAALADAASLKIEATELAQRIATLGLRLAGPAAGAFVPRLDGRWGERLATLPPEAVLWTANYLFERAGGIYGGTTEIQKNILWRMIEGSR